MRPIVLLVVVVLIALVPLPAAAEYPERPVTCIVG